MKKFVEWLIKKYLPGYHLHKDPVRKKEVHDPETVAQDDMVLNYLEKVERIREEVSHGNDIGSSKNKGI